MLSRKELETIFKQKADLLRDRETLRGLKEYASGDDRADLEEAIRSLEATIEGRALDLSEKDCDVKAMLSAVEDITARTILMLRFVDGHPWKEVALILGMNEKAVSNRGYKALHQYFDEVSNT